MMAVRYNSAGFVQQMTVFLAQVKQPRRIMAAVGREGRNQLVGHFRKKDREGPNKLGGKREHFWLQVGRSVQTPLVDASGRTVTISINDPRIAQKVFGGTIRAKRAKNLALPKTAEAYGRAPEVFEREMGLKLFVLTTQENAFLAAIDGPGVKIEYLLTPSVSQKADPTALPPQAEMESALLRRAESEVERIKSQSGLT